MVALVTGPLDTASAVERREGFRDALAGEVEGDYSFRSGVDAGERLLALSPRPTAVFAANDVMAAGVLKVAASRQIRVPQDISVMEFDGSVLTEMLIPALTTVFRPFGEMTRLAADLLINRIGSKEISPAESLEPMILEADSTGPAPN